MRYDKDLLAMYERVFDGNQIIDESPHHIDFGRPGSSLYFVRFVLFPRALGLWGDVNAAVFAYGPGGASLRDLVKWFGLHGGVHYIGEKWAIGSSLSADEWDEDMARSDLDDLACEYWREAMADWQDCGDELDWGVDVDIDEDAVRRIKALKEIRDDLDLDGWSEDSYFGALSDAGEDDFWHMGHVLPSRALMAIAACRACARAVKAKEEAIVANAEAMT